MGCVGAARRSQSVLNSKEEARQSQGDDILFGLSANAKRWVCYFKAVAWGPKRRVALIFKVNDSRQAAAAAAAKDEPVRSPG